MKKKEGGGGGEGQGWAELEVLSVEGIVKAERPKAVHIQAWQAAASPSPL